jgi:large subunit ribosomal protein L19
MAKQTDIKFSPVNIEARKKLSFRSGDTVKVTSKIVDEKGKSRLQAFEGIVLSRKHGTEPGATFTVRRVASGVGTERIFPLFSPMIEKIEVTKKSRSRRSKLYYIRDKALRRVRKKLRLVTGQMEKDEYVESEQTLEIPEDEMIPEENTEAETEVAETPTEDTKEEKSPADAESSGEAKEPSSAKATEGKEEKSEETKQNIKNPLLSGFLVA